jgi:two-component system chemotaxis response regulator CheB
MSQRILIVDDSPFIRRVVADWLSDEPDFEVVGSAVDGEEALAKVEELRPDLIILDVEMPKRDGLWALEEIMGRFPAPVIMAGSPAPEGAPAMLRALDLGAVDFVTKPEGGEELGLSRWREEMVRKVRASRCAKVGQRPGAPAPAARVASGRDRVVLVASSTGGPKALARLFEALPKGFPAAMLLVQHMPPAFIESLAKRLDGFGTIPCRVARAGDRATPGLALLAPGDAHMRVGPGGELSFDAGPPLHGVRPAADPLFVSSAEVFGSRCIGVVLTGMGRDGAEGAAALRATGAPVFGESESTCTIYGMPKAARLAGGIDREAPIHEMARLLAAELSKGGLARAS